jgi:cell wall-associated NlpC family hydrolase
MTDARAEQLAELANLHQGRVEILAERLTSVTEGSRRDLTASDHARRAGVITAVRAALAQERRAAADFLLQAELVGAETRALQERQHGAVPLQPQRPISDLGPWTTSMQNGAQASSRAVAAVKFALDRRGLPYRYGATGPNAYDCSGLTQQAYRSVGINLPRVSTQQYGAGRHVERAALLPGDLVFQATDVTNPATIHHVAVYIGNGLVVHAPHTGDVVRIAPLWSSGYIGATRIIAAVQHGHATKPGTPRPSPLPPVIPSPSASPSPSPAAPAPSPSPATPQPTPVTPVPSPATPESAGAA